MSSIFTKIIKKEIPSYILYEDDLVMAFLDITQSTKGHTLVITKKEYTNIMEVPEYVFTYLFSVVHKLSKILLKTFNASGLNLVNNNGIIAGQTVLHYHVHLILRFDLNEIQINIAKPTTNLTPSYFLNIQKQILSNISGTSLDIKKIK
ncbi:HIT family protein [Candidatus Phytoplasma phoenicium]|uniref:Histidine triad (HIT) nucleotide-binding protein n=1 Tax=Candidatus Phytoplasma phoenicium TaxID=198422 RepID=A0A0L0MJS2_9MOLU|nr:HIT family protein [Candidatus Phytoplasma phoenicium]KND62545.1 Histidine triad (HIT) nucleotide-binding protein [Candidatus Phytoplasma phoenicium]